LGQAETVPRFDLDPFAEEKNPKDKKIHRAIDFCQKSRFESPTGS
jgi:hypothetical protein